MSKVLWQSSRRVLNKRICKEVWLEAWLLLSDLIDKKEYFQNRWELIDWWFYNTIENIEEDTGLTRKTQTKAISKLKKIWFIQTKLMWVPAKKHFKIETNKIDLFLQSSMSQRDKLVCPNGTTNNTKDNNTKGISLFSKENKDEIVEYWDVEINVIDKELRSLIEWFWMSYKHERFFLNHMKSKKWREIAIKHDHSNPLEFSLNIVKCSMQNQTKYDKWYMRVNSAKIIYQNFAEIINDYKRWKAVLPDNSKIWAL